MEFASFEQHQSCPQRDSNLKTGIKNVVYDDNGTTWIHLYNFLSIFTFNSSLVDSIMTINWNNIGKHQIKIDVLGNLSTLLPISVDENAEVQEQKLKYKMITLDSGISLLSLIKYKYKSQMLLVNDIIEHMNLSSKKNIISKNIRKMHKLMLQDDSLINENIEIYAAIKSGYEIEISGLYKLKFNCDLEELLQILQNECNFIIKCTEEFEYIIQKLNREKIYIFQELISKLKAYYLNCPINSKIAASPEYAEMICSFERSVKHMSSSLIYTEFDEKLEQKVNLYRFKRLIPRLYNKKFILI